MPKILRRHTAIRSANFFCQSVSFCSIFVSLYMDLLFYGIAIYEGYKFSFRQIIEQELATLKTS